MKKTQLTASQQNEHCYPLQKVAEHKGTNAILTQTVHII